MKYLVLILLLMTSTHNTMIFDFNREADISAWRVVNDTVMGGRSSAKFRMSKEGHGEFTGSVSLENNGGFSSVRYRFSQMEVGSYTKLVLRLKGDGKQYQIRVKDNSGRYYSYINYFETTGDWEEIEIPLAEMYAYYRGYKLDRPNFNHNTLEEIALLIGNKKEEEFHLLIDRVSLR